MSRREKIIVGVVIVALVGAAFDFFIGFGEFSTAVREDEDSSGDLTSVVATVEGSFAAMQLSPARELVIEKAPLQWKDDLFSPEQATLFEENGDGGETQSKEPAFTGYFNIGGNALGIIDGNDYAEGEWLEDGSFQVIGITPGGVELRPANKNETVVIPIEQNL